MSKHEGIILRHHIPKAYKIALFDKELGRIEGIIHKKTTKTLHAIQHGAYLTYSISYQTKMLIENIEIIHIPFHLAAHDIEFLHHILELCDFYISHDNHLQHLFTAMIDVLITKDVLSSKEKQLFLCIFFANIGLYPDKPLFDIEEFKKTDRVVLLKKLDELDSNMIQSWILECINMHPNKSRFRTLHTLKNKL